MTTKHDAEKARWDLLPVDAVGQIVDVLTFGARKYAPENWRTVPEWKRRYYAATLRHLVAWWGGERTDPESGLPHLAHAGCCLLFLAALDREEDSPARAGESITPIVIFGTAESVETLDAEEAKRRGYPDFSSPPCVVVVSK